MPLRHDIFINGGVYHVYNKTLDHREIFKDPRYCGRFIDLVRYYRSSKHTTRYSQFLKLPDYLKNSIYKELEFKKYFKVEILCYCLMPNHFHLLIKQKHTNGIVRVMADILNALTRYYNIVNKRQGAIFLTQFKSKQILTKEQLIHVSRYIHLNPYSAGLVKNFDELSNYTFSSFREYQNSNPFVCNTDTILSQFNESREKYRLFMSDNANYQKSLEYYKHIRKWG